MPLFGRRQSEGNTLDLMEKPRSADPNGSAFTVLSQEEVAARKARREAVEAAEKEKSSRKSFGFSFPTRGKSRMSTYDEDSGSSNRGSNSSSAANSYNSNMYSAGSSTRLSSASTLPSSNGGETADDLYIQRSSTYGMPSVPRPLTHRDRATTLAPGESFTRYNSPRDTSLPPLPSTVTPPPPPVPEHSSSWSRSRATTASSYASTARPPKLDLGISNFGDFAENMFGADGKDSNGLLSQSPEHSPDLKPPRPPPHTYVPQAPNSPYNAHEFDAHAPLLSSPREKSPATPSFSSTLPKENSFGSTPVTQPIARPGPQPITRPISQPAIQSVTQPTARPATQPTPLTAPTSRPPLPPNPPNLATNNRKPSYSVDLTPKSAIPAPFSQDELDDEPLFPSSSKPAFRTPEPPETKAEDDSPSRMVTAAEFEKLKMLADQSSDHSNDDDEYASDSEAEESDSEKKRRDRWAREKQQGDLAVNRQIYRKTVGGQPESQPNRFSAQGSTVTTPLRESDAEKRQFEQDGDWDVPLGALAAHGFPKSGSPRPFTGGRQVSTSSQADYRSSAQFVTETTPPPRPMSTVSSVAGQAPRASAYLPPFAKGLPMDPYSGGVVPGHPREQLRFNGRSSSVPVIPSMPPQTNSTLMDVIVGEERARASRRGSPSAAGLQGQQYLNEQNQQHPFRQSMMPQQMPMAPNGYMSPQQYQMAVSTPEMQILQQQLQLQQQIMVQMQQQMLQLTTMSSGGSVINGQAPSIMQQPMFMQQNQTPGQSLQIPSIQQRPMSMTPNMNGMSGGGYQNRPMSTYSPSMYNMGRGNGYAASIAPSERNTTGMSPRYRSVGNLQADQYTSAGASPSTSRPPSRGAPIKATLRSAGSRNKLRSPSSDDSDEEKYFAEANERAKARRAKNDSSIPELNETFAVAL